MESFDKLKEFSKVNLDFIKIDGDYCKKSSFGTQKFADDYIVKLQKSSNRDKKPVESYLCAKCMNWHITSWEPLDIAELAHNLREKLLEFNENGAKAYRELGQKHSQMRNQLKDYEKEIKELKKKLAIAEYKEILTAGYVKPKNKNKIK